MATPRCSGAALAGWLVVSMCGNAQAADYQKYQNGACVAGSLCNINFPVVPAGKTLRLSNLSCYLRFNVVNDLYGAQLLLLNASGGVIMAVTPQFAKLGTVTVNANSEYVLVSNETIRVMSVAGQRFRAFVEVRNCVSGTAGTVSQYACHISGDVS